jgi:deoxycytidylate deaminase
MMAKTDKAKKLTNEDFRRFKSKIRDKYNLHNINILTSDYFKYFDNDCPKDMSCRQEYYLHHAAHVAMHSNMNHKHGAVIVYKKNIISVGYNHYCGTTSIHAEIAAINNLKGRDKCILDKCQLYVARIGPDRLDNPLKYSKPCNSCQNYIAKKSIKQIFYSTNYEFDKLVTSYEGSVGSQGTTTESETL